MSTPEEEKKKKAAVYAKKTQKPADERSASKANASMGMLPPEAFGDFLQLQPLPLQPPLSNFVNPQQQQKNFQQLGTQFLQQNPSLSSVSSLQGGSGVTQALQLAGPGKYLALASFLQQANKNSGTKGAKFSIDIGSDNPAQIIKDLQSKNLFDQVGKISFKENEQSKSLEGTDLIQMGMKVASQSVSGIPGRQSPFALPKTTDKPRPPGFEDQ